MTKIALFLPGTAVKLIRRKPEYDKDYPDEIGEIVEVNGHTAWVSTAKSHRGLRCYFQNSTTHLITDTFANSLKKIEENKGGKKK